MSIPQPLACRSGMAMRRRPAPTWLWEPYIPIGRLTLVDGSEGIGKGFFAVHLAMMTLVEGRNVLWFTAEDDPEEDLHRRLLAAGWDVSPKTTHGDVLFYDGMGEDSDVFGVPRDTAKMAATIRQYKATLVILDPGRSFLKPPKGQQMSYNDDALVRPGLQKLNQLASRTKVAMPFIHHWKRDSSSSPSERFSGSGAFSQNCRHRVTLARYSIETDAEAVFSVTKTNISTRGHMRNYHLELAPEHESVVFRDDGPNRTDRDIDSWWRRKDQEAKSGVLVDQTDEVVAWLKQHCAVGVRVPSRDEVQSRTGISYKYVKSGYQKVTDAGWVRDAGRKGLVWLGTGGTNGQGVPSAS